MKWLEELKEEVEQLKIHTTHDETGAMGYYTISMKTLDRIIEIAERAWPGEPTGGLRHCPICGYDFPPFQNSGPLHNKGCPYSDEWRKE